MPNLRLEILPASQRRLWAELQKNSRFLKDHRYYLAGGSALALQIGHRQSVDFDFFSQQKDLGRPAEKWLRGFKGSRIREGDAETLHAEIRAVKVSFIGAYRYPLLEPASDHGGIRIAGLLDIALMKLLAVTHRATMRDYLDLAILLRDHFDLGELLQASLRKYGKNFNVMIPLRALVAFSDIDPETPVLLDRNLKASWQKILRAAVKKAAE